SIKRVKFFSFLQRETEEVRRALKVRWWIAGLVLSLASWRFKIRVRRILIHEEFLFPSPWVLRFGMVLRTWSHSFIVVCVSGWILAGWRAVPPLGMQSVSRFSLLRWIWLDASLKFGWLVSSQVFSVWVNEFGDLNCLFKFDSLSVLFAIQLRFIGVVFQVYHFLYSYFSYLIDSL
ncbi:hypothetical protein LINPERHAP2_LOCUS19157, partial [Linum perenne]